MLTGVRATTEAAAATKSIFFFYKVERREPSGGFYDLGPGPLLGRATAGVTIIIIIITTTNFTLYQLVKYCENYNKFPQIEPKIIIEAENQQYQPNQTNSYSDWHQIVYFLTIYLIKHTNQKKIPCVCIAKHICFTIHRLRYIYVSQYIIRDTYMYRYTSSMIYICIAIHHRNTYTYKYLILKI